MPDPKQVMLQGAATGQVVSQDHPHGGSSSRKNGLAACQTSRIRSGSGSGTGFAPDTSRDMRLTIRRSRRYGNPRGQATPAAGNAGIPPQHASPNKPAQTG